MAAVGLRRRDDRSSPAPAPRRRAAPRRTGHRPVVFARGRAAVDVPVYRRATLGAGDRFDGPAIVEERETTA